MPDLEFRIVVRDDGTAVIQRFTSNLQATAAKAEKSGGRIGGAFRRVTRGIKGAFGQILSFRSAIAGIVVGAGLREIVRTFVQFESQMNRVAALTGAVVGPAFDRLEAQARLLGETTVFSATQAADAMAFLAKAGFEAEEVMAALPPTLTLAAAASIDLGQAADITTNILTGLRLPFEELERANDVLVKAFTSSNVSLTELGQSFKFVGPIALSAGVEFEELTAALGLLGNAGIQAGMAGTTLRGIIFRLLDPSKEAADRLKELGISALDSSGKLRPLNEIIEQFQKSTFIAADLAKIFAQRAGPGMAALIGQGSAELRKFTKELKDSGGIAKRIADVQIRGLTGSLVRLRSSFEGVKITIGTSLKPAFVEIIDTFTGFFQNISTAAKAVRDIEAAMGSATGSTDDFETSLDGMVPTVSTLTSAMITFNIAAESVSLIFETLITGASILTLPFAKLSDAIGLTTEALRTNLNFLDQMRVQIDASVRSLREAPEAFDRVGATVKRLGEEQRRLAESTRISSMTVKEQSTELKIQLAVLEKRVALAREKGVPLRLITKEDVESTDKLLERVPFRINQFQERVRQGAEDFKIGLELSIDAAGESFKRFKLDPKAQLEIFEQVSQAQGSQAIAFRDAVNIQVNIATERDLLLSQLGEERREEILREQGFMAETNAEQVEIVRERVDAILAQEERQAAAQAQIARLNFQTTKNFIQAGVGLVAAAGGKNFAQSKAFAIGQAVIAGTLATIEALASPPGPPATFGLAASVAAIAAANIAAIASAKPGGGGGRPATGGGGGMIAPSAGAVPAAPALAMPIQGGQQINISVAGFIGNEAELASALGPVIAEAVGDNVDFGLEVSR